MGKKTEKHLARAFAAESRASIRNEAFALKADKEGLPQVARLFRAVSKAEAVHANRYLLLMRGKIGSTKENIKNALEMEIGAKGDEYQRIIEDVEGEGAASAVIKAFSQSRKTEAGHRRILKEANEGINAFVATTYHVCRICGHISEDGAPENCPVCGAVQSRFRKII